VTRRDLLKTAALGAGLAAADRASAQSTPVSPASQSAGSRPAASDRLGVGLIGVGNFGSANLRQFSSHADVEIVAICDVLQSNLDRAIASSGGKATPYRDYRRLLDDPRVDAVVITTPEHWHALMCIDACNAGKDVYVEKPIAHHIRDGRLMVEAARRHTRIVQVGSQQRSGRHFQRAVQYIQDGRIGDVHYACCWNHSPRPTPRPLVTGGPPDGLDWDLWLGPAPKTPYDEVQNVGRRGSWAFWGGMLTEWGSHLADVVLWAMQVQGPQQVSALGGRFNGRGEIPDTLLVSYKYPTFLFQYSILTHNTFGPNGDAGAARFGSYGTQFHGTKGTLFVDRGGFRITPQTTRIEEQDLPPGPSPPDMRAPGFYYTTGILAEQADSSLQHEPHVRNFIDCVKSRARPHADIEAGHYTNTTCRLGNIAYRLGRTLTWDGAKEQIIGDAEANQLAIGTYRDPWKPKGL